MRYTVYVDSLYGLDSNTGELLSPVKTLPYALTQVYEGGVIVLQSGNGISYGNLTVTKNLTIKSAYGAVPIVGSLTLLNMQGLIEGLTFKNISTGITANNLSIGSTIVRGCRFSSVNTAISINSVNYISIHRNYFYEHQSAIKINSAKEVCVNSNDFSNGQKSIDIVTVDRLDLWGNTIYGALDLPPILFPDTNLRIIYKTINAFDISHNRIQLPGFASPTNNGKYDVAVNIVNGPSFNYGTDFIVISLGSIVSWNGLQLSQELAIGDIVRIMYSEAGDIDPGRAISISNIGDKNSRVDSNSISSAGIPISTGVYFNTPVKILNNNFDDVLVWWGGSVPTGGTGMNNIGETAMYRDPFNEDFRLQPSSPNIDRGDFDRWNNIYGEIGIKKVNIDGGWYYTASYTGIRDNVSPFDRDIDFDLFHRGATGIQGATGDIGAFEFNYNETALGNYVAEYGYDKDYPGTETGPYATPDRGYQRSGTNDLHIATNVVPSQNGETGLYTFYTTGSSYSRFRSKEMILSGSNLIIGTRTRNDVVIIYPSHPSFETGLIYASPDGNDLWTGTFESPYRTIDRALQNGSQYVVVEPGYYPSFHGVTGISLIGVERYLEIGLSGIFYSNVRDGSWTGVGTYSYDMNDLTLTSPSDIMGGFNFNTDVDIKLFVTVESDNLMVNISNNDNSAYIKINRSLSVITYGYMTGINTYEINYSISDPHTSDEIFSDLKVRFIFNGNKFIISIDGKYIHGSYTNNFISGSFTNWVLRFTNSGSGDDIISNLSAFSSAIVGATGISSTVTLKKLFAIMGSTGIQG
jgi:hypothetical protein